MIEIRFDKTKDEVALLIWFLVDHSVWERRSNKEILELYGQQSISNVARVQSMRWLGHVARVNDDIPTKQALMRGITGRRKRGRPRSQWIQMVEGDLNEVGMVDWRG
jgi:hypothetical protein